jgi:hypothetical protein
MKRRTCNTGNAMPITAASVNPYRKQAHTMVRGNQLILMVLGLIAKHDPDYASATDVTLGCSSTASTCGWRSEMIDSAEPPFTNGSTSQTCPSSWVTWKCQSFGPCTAVVAVNQFTPPQLLEVRPT